MMEFILVVAQSLSVLYLAYGAWLVLLCCSQKSMEDGLDRAGIDAGVPA